MGHMGIVLAILMVCIGVGAVGSVLWTAIDVHRLHRSNRLLFDGSGDKNIVAFGIGGSNFLHS